MNLPIKFKMYVFIVARNEAKNALIQADCNSNDRSEVDQSTSA